MNEYTDQISGYFNQVPMWPLVLLAVAIVISGIYELFHRKRRAGDVRKRDVEGARMHRIEMAA